MVTMRSLRELWVSSNRRPNVGDDLERELAERDQEIARLREAIDVTRILVRERDARLEKLESLVKLQFGQSAFQALRERDERIAELERIVGERERALQQGAAELWRLTERVQSLGAELDALRATVERRSA